MNYTKRLRDKLWEMESSNMEGPFPSIENGGHMPNIVVIHKNYYDTMEDIQRRGETMKFHGVKLVFSENMLENKGFIYDFTGKLIGIVDFKNGN